MPHFRDAFVRYLYLDRQFCATAEGYRATLPMLLDLEETLGHMQI